MLPVAVGVEDDEVVLLDLARSPGLVSVHGSPGPADRLVAALAAQLTAGLFGAPDTLLLHDAALGSPLARPLPELIAVLEQRPAGRHPRTVLVCSRPGEGDVPRLTELAARDPGLIVLVAGYLPGSRWRLRVTSPGRVVAPELGIDADAAPLWKGLEQAIAARPAVAHVAPARERPIWADEAPAPVTVDAPPPPEPTTTDDLIEPVSADAASSRSSGDR